ncbi:ABC transporter permease [Streptomyces sp. NBS 14/10]|uniref:ABC transporter permease n=1 Tax=Streptomyces sp. NBS 14/10 TaxID=1945643 RepID=UPI000B7D4924|nr:ABC transporter permease [Streptomyces sp. NBS 14/10]KAK1185654.1 ABC transporter permease [Streptomyces sp. NBS 14/10]NUP40973.1 ABC transporter permease [Streptomyces sp.]NUS90499.1 ABC transporter permease [Streptomyces sp.]
MVRFIVRRLMVLLITLLAVSAATFAIPYASGGDPVRTILRSRVSDQALDPSAIAALRSELGLDRPILVQYLSWLGRAVRGDFGMSFTSRTPVDQLLGTAIGVSGTLAVIAIGLAFLAALPLGTLAAMRPGKRVDNGVTLLTQSFVAVPEYWLAPILVLVFSRYLGWLPSAGWRDPTSIILPALTLALRPMAYFTQVTRAAMSDVLASPYMTAARSRGLSGGQALLRHGLRNALLPVMTLFSLWFAGLLGGSVVVEVIFAIPGMGRLVYSAVVNHDVPLIQGGILCTVALAVLITTVTDLLYALINPAVRVRDGAV